jgi:[acyl-carrier-protein] S-malonyltransferase
LLEAPADVLATTDVAQIATLALSLVAWEVVGPRLEGDLVAVAGHSLGQLTALVATGAVPRTEGIALAVARADACRASDDARPGRLAALLGATLEQAGDACRAAPGECWVANDNAPGQVVLGGTPEGLGAAVAAARAAGVRKVIALPVGGGFHTPLMEPAVDRWRPHLAATRFADPVVPVVDNTLAEVRRTGAPWPDLLARHLVEPVRWRESQVVLAARLGAREVVELAPAGALAAMARRTIPDVAVRTVEQVLEGVGA